MPIEQTYHNWNQLKNFLENLGFIQKPTHNEWLYFHNQANNQHIGYKKSNKISVTYILRILAKLGITYESFLLSYRQTNNP